MTSKSNVATPAALARRQAAARVRRARVAAGLTQAEAAALAGISERSYRDIELGRVRMAALEALIVLEAEASRFERPRPSATLQAPAFEREDHPQRKPGLITGSRASSGPYHGGARAAGSTPAGSTGDRVADVVLDAANQTTGGDEPCTLSPNNLTAPSGAFGAPRVQIQPCPPAAVDDSSSTGTTSTGEVEREPFRRVA